MSSFLKKESSEGEGALQKIVDAVQNYDVTSSLSWSDLDSLSSHTQIDGVEADPAGVIFTDARRQNFRGVHTVYVLLSYGNGDDQFEQTDAFPGRFSGHINEQGDVSIDDFTVDTSKFYS